MNDRDPLAALLELIETDRAARIDAIEAEARATARALVAQGRRAARERVHDALVPERRRLRERLAALDARLATATRLAAQRRLRARIDAAWRVLPAALQARWAGPVSRAAWTALVREAAVEALGKGPWRVSHAAGWPQRDREDFAQAVVASGAGPVAFDECATIEAGLVVRAGGSVVDASASGLLADRGAIDAGLADALGLGESPA